MSEIRATTISDSAGTGPITLTKQYAAKMYANANHQTLSITESFNTSSITDLQTGRLRFDLTNNMNTTSYCLMGFSRHYGGVTYSTSCSQGNGSSASYFELSTMSVSGTLFDASELYGQTTGDLA